MFRVVVVLALLAACGGSKARPHRPGEEYLDSIRIVGNTAISSDDLLPGLALQRNADEQRSIDDYQLQLDQQRIVTAFQKLGYFNVDVRARIDHKGDAATVTFTITQGARATAQVQIDGLPPEVPLATARKLIELADGAPFDYDAFDDAKLPMQRLIEDAGYPHADVESKVAADRAHSRATMQFVIDAGTRATFGAVTVTGVEGSLADAARARIKFHAGEIYSTTAIEATQSAIYGMARFSIVRIQPDRDGEAAVVPVKISLTEGAKNEIALGGGFGADPITYSARARIAYTRRGFLNPLTTLVTDLRPEYAVVGTFPCGWEVWSCAEPRIRALAVVTRQDLFGLTDVKGDVELGADYLMIEAYTREGAHARLGLATPIVSKRLQLRVGWQYTISHFLDITINPTDAHAIGIEQNNYSGAYTGAIVLDLRDKPIEPTRGIYVEARIAKGTPLAGSELDYLEVTPEARAFVPVGPLVIAARIRYGAIFGQVPATERFYGGGMSSMRGFAQRQLSPFAPSVDGTQDIVIGGAGLIENSVEVRGPLGKIGSILLGGVAFLDGGNVTSLANAINIGDQYWATGAGLRWLSPIGPVGLDIAYRLNRTGPGNYDAGSHFNWLIAVGEAF